MQYDTILPFIGIHPEIYRSIDSDLSIDELDTMMDQVSLLIPRAKGIGEIGLDSVYGHFENQKLLFSGMLRLAEKTGLPTTIHSRSAISEILNMLKTHKLKGKILFHWFSGTKEELKQVQDCGMYVSFGPAIIFSKRMSTLVESADTRFILAETDSPTRYKSLLDSPSDPILVASVIFRIGMLLGISFERAVEMVLTNSSSYLGTQN